MGLVIQSPKLAERLAEIFDTTVPRAAYEVRLAADGQKLQWIERNASGEARYDTEPETSWGLRLGVYFLQFIPIDSLL